MLVIPAIDLAQGQCVRLQQGDMGRKTVFATDPAEVARRWEDQGAELIHVVDLDGAMQGRPANLASVAAIVKAVQVPVELGGGLRNHHDVARVLDLGVRYAIMGTSALADRPEFEYCLARFGGAIIAGIDARDGRVAVQGWTETSDVSAVELGQQLGSLGVARIIFTDIATDGMLSGPNISSLQAMLQAVSVPLVASGGVTTLDDIRKLMLLEPAGLIGCIVGRALYSGTIVLSEAIRVGRTG